MNALPCTLVLPARWVRSISTRGACVGLPKLDWRFPPSPAASSLPTWPKQMRRLSQQDDSQYGSRRADYDLKKLRGKQIICRLGKTARYETIPQGPEPWQHCSSSATKPLNLCSRLPSSTGGPDHRRTPPL
jgi:hypothetical protein